MSEEEIERLTDNLCREISNIFTSLATKYIREGLPVKKVLGLIQVASSAMIFNSSPNVEEAKILIENIITNVMKDIQQERTTRSP